MMNWFLAFCSTNVTTLYKVFNTGVFLPCYMNSSLMWLVKQVEFPFQILLFTGSRMIQTVGWSSRGLDVVGRQTDAIRS